MKKLFQKIAEAGKASGIDMSKLKDAQSWFRSKAAGLKNVNANELLRSDTQRFMKTNTITTSGIGKMLMFFYDPKLKYTLPYFDRFPLIFVIQVYDDGFLGMNLHYISPVQRAKLLNALYDTMTSDKSDGQKLSITYKILKGSAKFRLFKPCVKRYLYSHVKSKFFIVSPEEWDFIIMLPLERWDTTTSNGINKSKVYQDSNSKI